MNVIPLTLITYMINTINRDDDVWSMSPKTSNYNEPYNLYFRNKDDIDIWRKTHPEYKIIKQKECIAFSYNGTLYPMYSIDKNEIYNFF